jgi:two-component system LytT family response regulator
MRVLVIDDERRARERLSRLLAAFPDVEVAGEAEDGISALEAIGSLRPDAVFLDVQMPGLDGFEVLAELGEDQRPLIIFVTAYDQYALQAFEVNAVDYLMKPVEEDRLARAIGRLRERASRDGIVRLIAALQKPQPLQRIVARKLQKLHVLPVNTVEAFVSDGDLVFALTLDGRFLVDKTLRELEGALDQEQFARVHKGAIINLQRLVVLEPILKGGATARLQSGHIIEISRRYSQPLRQRLGW